MAYRNPADEAMPYLEEIPDTLKPYYDPYINAGQESLSTLMDQYRQLLSNPQALFNRFGAGYEQSPGYQFNYSQGMNGINSAAAAGGMLGTPGHQLQAGKFSSDMASQDYNNYLQRMMGLYGRGMEGMQGMNQMGYGASSELGQSLAANLMNQGNMAYNGQANQNRADADFWNNMIGLGTTAAGYVGIGNGNNGNYY